MGHNKSLCNFVTACFSRSRKTLLIFAFEEPQRFPKRSSEPSKVYRRCKCAKCHALFNGVEYSTPEDNPEIFNILDRAKNEKGFDLARRRKEQVDEAKEALASRG